MRAQDNAATPEKRTKFRFRNGQAPSGKGGGILSFPVPQPVSESIVLLPFDRAKAMPAVTLKNGGMTGLGPWFRWFFGGGGPLAFQLRFYGGTIWFNARKLYSVLRMMPAVCVWIGRLARMGFRCDMVCLSMETKKVWGDLKAFNLRGEMDDWACLLKRNMAAGCQMAVHIAGALDPRWWLIRGKMGLAQLAQAIRSWPGVPVRVGHFILAWIADLVLQGWRCSRAGLSWMRAGRRVSQPEKSGQRLNRARMPPSGLLAEIIALQREEIARLMNGGGRRDKPTSCRMLFREAIREQVHEGGEAFRSSQLWFRQLKRCIGPVWSGGSGFPRSVADCSRPAAPASRPPARDIPPRPKGQPRVGKPAVPPWTCKLYRLTLASLLPVMVAASLGTSLVVGECFIRIETARQRRANKQYVAFQMARNGHVIAATERVTYRLTDRSARAFLDIGQTEQMMGELRRQYGSAGDVRGDGNAAE